MKHIYRAMVLLIVFIASFMFMSKNMKEVQFEFDTTVAMGEATFPVVELTTGAYTINLLHGYRSNLEANIIRENLMPIDMNKTLEVVMIENQIEVRKLKYEIRTIVKNELLDSGTISALNDTKTTKGHSAKSAKIKIKAELDQGKEYAAKITLVTSEGRKIHYYTRIKYYGEDAFLKQKIDFIMDFHNQLLNKEKAKNLTAYLEPNSSMDNTTLSLVNIHSSFDNFSWGNLKPELVSDIVFSIKEFNIETAAVELRYFVAADAGSKEKEIYQIKEFFRVRYTKDRMYLLNYQRTMEAQFNIDLVSMAKSEIKLGISGEKDIKLVTSSNNDRVSFVRQGNLWYYNLAENKAVQVFSFQGNKEKKDYIWDYYDQHDIRILNMEDNGDMNFLVYGYINRGDYEGRVAILLYKFYANEKRIEEQVYIPLETTFQMLKEDLNEFSYVNEKGVFYFTMNHVIYAYNIIAKRLNTIASGLHEENFMIPKEENFIGWQNSNIPTESKKITLLNLETEEEHTITAPEGDTIKILGNIDENIIYGFAHAKDITETKDGTIVVPLYQILISDQQGNVVKNYERKGIYVTEIEIKENIIGLHRVVKKTNGGKVSFVDTKPDNIINMANEVKKSINITTRITDIAMEELYISLPAGFEMAKKPKLSGTVNTIITADTTLRLNQMKEQTKIEKYYVYALGGILTSYSNPSEAIIAADANMGVVVDHNNQIVWERGGQYNRKMIYDIEPIYTKKGVNSIDACLEMVIRYKKGSASPIESVKGQSIYQGLLENLNSPPINLTGCNLAQMLYFVSSSRPVIAMKNQEQAVLIIGYDEYYITMIDPEGKNTVKKSLIKATELFEQADNLFISYME